MIYIHHGNSFNLKNTFVIIKTKNIIKGDRKTKWDKRKSKSKNYIVKN